MNTTNTPAPAAVTKVSTITGVLNLVLAAIKGQNDITVVSSEIEKLDGSIKGQPKGERVRLVLTGAGVGDSTRRYFLRNNSAFASLVEGAGAHVGAPKKSREDSNYTLYFATDAKVAGWQPAPEPKAEKVKMSKEEKAAARQAGKARARAERAAAAVREAEGVTA